MCGSLVARGFLPASHERVEKEEKYVQNYPLRIGACLRSRLPAAIADPHVTGPVEDSANKYRNM